MLRLQRYLSRMVLFLSAVGGVGAVLYPSLLTAFQVSPALNGLILGVLLIGITYSFLQVTKLFREVRWLRRYRAGDLTSEDNQLQPVLLAPLAIMLGGQRERMEFSALSMRSVLDGIYARLDESREISRYFISLLIFLGLLGTFWGLLGTIRSVGGVIDGLSLEGGDVAAMFSGLQKGLAAPLSGMGAAFSASLFGLAGSLVLGFLELQASQAQNRFFQDVEDWLSSGARLRDDTSHPPLEAGSEPARQTLPAYMEALLEQTAETIDTLQRTLLRSEEERRQTTAVLAELSDKIGTLAEIQSDQLMQTAQLAEGMASLRPVLRLLNETVSETKPAPVPVPTLDEESRLHLRNIDLRMAQLVEEADSGRDRTLEELRSDIRIITRTITALAEDAGPR